MSTLLRITTLASNDNKLKQSSGQMLISINIIPLLSDNIEKNPHIPFVLGLIETDKIFFAPVVSIKTLTVKKDRRSSQTV